VQAGATGYLMKDAQPDAIRAAGRPSTAVGAQSQGGCHEFDPD
jgi:hypothetical protein